MKGRDPLFIPCTPYGCIVLLEESGIPIRGAEAVVVGRSNIVGLPVAMLLQKRDATVTICHSRTRDLADHIRRADIVIAAIGQMEMITGDMLKPGAAVIDVGINQKATRRPSAAIAWWATWTSSRPKKWLERSRPCPAVSAR